MPFKEYWYDLGGANAELLSVVYGSGKDWLSDVWPYLDFIGDTKQFPYLLIACALMFMAKFCYKNLNGYASNFYLIRSYIAWLCAFVAGFFVLTFALQWAHEFFAFPRPYIDLSNIKLLYGAEHIRGTHQSFPSEHVAFTALWMSLLWSQCWWGFRFVLLLALLSMCWFRMTIGASFPMDVLAGILLGASVGVIPRILFLKLFRVRH